MLREKKKILILRIVFSILFVIGIALAIFSTINFGTSNILNYAFIFVAVVSFTIVIATLRMRVKTLEYKGQNYVIYAGIFKAYLKQNNEIVAVNDSYHKYQPMHLIHKLDEEKTLYVTIRWSNRIAIEIVDNDYKLINGQMYGNMKD